jgi:hypothetical protein
VFRAKPTAQTPEDKAELIRELRASAMRKWTEHVTKKADQAIAAG